MVSGILRECHTGVGDVNTTAMTLLQIDVVNASTTRYYELQRREETQSLGGDGGVAHAKEGSD